MSRVSCFERSERLVLVPKCEIHNRQVYGRTVFASRLESPDERSSLLALTSLSIGCRQQHLCVRTILAQLDRFLISGDGFSIPMESGVSFANTEMCVCIVPI